MCSLHQTDSIWGICGAQALLKEGWYLLWNEIHVYLWTSRILPITMDGFSFGHYTPLQNRIVTTFVQISLDLSQMCQTTLQDALLCWRNEILSVGFSDEISTCVCKLYNLCTEMTLKKKRFLWSALYFLPSSGRLFAKASLNLITA